MITKQELILRIFDLEMQALDFDERINKLEKAKNKSPIDGKNELQGGVTLEILTKDWEDVPEEPKDFWYIGDLMIICGTEGEFTTPDLASFTKKDIEKLKAIGNYFLSREEAEKAVEKLKAWKRLKDKGFRLKRWEWEFIYNDNISGELIIKAHIDDATDSDGKYTKDLDLLFGGEDDN